LRNGNRTLVSFGNPVKARIRSSLDSPSKGAKPEQDIPQGSRGPLVGQRKGAGSFGVRGEVQRWERNRKKIKVRRGWSCGTHSRS